MSVRNGSRELVWLGAGVLCLLAVFFTVLSRRTDRDPSAQIAFKAERLDLVNAMRLSLAAVSEAQNGAVMSTGELDAAAFADQSRSATEALEGNRGDLEKLLLRHGDAHELDLMSRVAAALKDFQQIDTTLLELATQSSNRKAFRLAFGPAMQLLQQIDEPLAQIAASQASSVSENSVRVLQLASDVRIGVLRMQVLMLPHIAEESDQKMDAFEMELSEEDRKVREKLAALDAVLPESEKALISTVTSRYAAFEELRSQIIKLSRENTDLRAVSLSLKEKRKAMLACQDALVALERAIQAEPITSVIPSGRSSH